MGGGTARRLNAIPSQKSRRLRASAPKGGSPLGTVSKEMTVSLFYRKRKHFSLSSEASSPQGNPTLCVQQEQAWGATPRAARGSLKPPVARSALHPAGFSEAGLRGKAFVTARRTPTAAPGFFLAAEVKSWDAVGVISCAPRGLLGKGQSSQCKRQGPT